jgi:hypothetical protein
MIDNRFPCVLCGEWNCDCDHRAFQEISDYSEPSFDSDDNFVFDD